MLLPVLLFALVQRAAPVPLASRPGSFTGPALRKRPLRDLLRGSAALLRGGRRLALAASPIDELKNNDIDPELKKKMKDAVHNHLLKKKVGKAVQAHLMEERKKKEKEAERNLRMLEKELENFPSDSLIAASQEAAVDVAVEGKIDRAAPFGGDPIVAKDRHNAEASDEKSAVATTIKALEARKAEKDKKDQKDGSPSAGDKGGGRMKLGGKKKSEAIAKKIKEQNSLSGILRACFGRKTGKNDGKKHAGTKG